LQKYYNWNIVESGVKHFKTTGKLAKPKLSV
jgi:hypothetical protein